MVSLCFLSDFRDNSERNQRHSLCPSESPISSQFFSISSQISAERSLNQKFTLILSTEPKTKILNKLKRVIDLLGVTLEELRSESRERRITDARTMLAAALPITQHQVAIILGCSQPAVHKMRKRHQILLRCDRKYRAKWEAVNAIDGNLSSVGQRLRRAALSSL